ncbi:MAG: hypothetical protein FWD69_05505 [Polyangiaceae bacterium]|nr:hypothetical protein [Polyangiaceae bacterium]
MRQSRVTMALAMVVFCIGSIAHAESSLPETDALFQHAVDALANDRPVDAIADFEALGDRGVVDAVVSYDRGLAYAMRVRAGAEQPGDMGRAVAGFEEARDLSRDTRLVADASKALGEVRAEIARRRARAGEPIVLEHGASFGRSIVMLLNENVWAMLTILASLALTMGVAVRARAKSTRGKVAGTTTAAIACGILLLAVLFVSIARDARKNLHEGIVITSHARLLDDRHIVKNALAPLPEGARVRIFDEGSDFVHVATSTGDGYLPVGTILPLAKSSK